MSADTKVLTPEESAELRRSTTIVVAYDRKPLVEAQAEWKEALTSWAEYSCETLEDEDNWSEAVGSAQAVFKKIEDERIKQTGPLAKELKGLNKEFREYQAPLVAFKELGSKVLSAARARRDEAERAAKALVAQAAAEGDEDATFDALAAVPETAKVDGTRTTYKWEMEITDISKVERKFLSFDHIAARTFMAKAYDSKSSQTIVMPGFTARCVPVVSTNGRKK